MALIIGAFLLAGVSYLTGAAFISHNFNVGIESLETLLGSIGIAIGTGAAIYAFFQFYYFYVSLYKCGFLTEFQLRLDCLSRL